MATLSVILQDVNVWIGGDLQFLGGDGKQLLRGRIRAINVEDRGVRVDFAWVVQGRLDLRSLVNEPEWVLHDQRGGYMICPLDSVLDHQSEGFFRCYHGGRSWSFFPRGHATVVDSTMVPKLILA